MQVESYISFRDELVKIAGVSLDAGMRAQVAAKNGLRPGIDYLPGGELPSNDPAQTNFEPKVASRAREIESKTYKKYKRYREPAAAGMRGALPGAFIANLLGSSKMGKNPTRAGALIGGGLGLADWAAAGKARRWAEKPGKRRRRKARKAAKAQTKVAMDSATFSPGRAKMQASSVGSFRDSIIHKGSPLRPLKMGQKFTIPGEPGQ